MKQLQDLTIKIYIFFQTKAKVDSSIEFKKFIDQQECIGSKHIWVKSKKNLKSRCCIFVAREAGRRLCMNY